MHVNYHKIQEMYIFMSFYEYHTKSAISVFLLQKCDQNMLNNNYKILQNNEIYE